MEPIAAIARHKAINRNEPLAHDWRVRQLTRPGVADRGRRRPRRRARNRQANAAGRLNYVPGRPV